jgi:long-subunit acyl-CoA synthetase (AMP-forming)
MAKVDISNAFLHVMLHPRVRGYFRFTWKGKCYRFKAMPFGLSSAPRILTKIMKEVVAHLRAQGFRLAFYIDDIIIFATSAADCRQQARFRSQRSKVHSGAGSTRRPQVFSSSAPLQRHLGRLFVGASH